MYMGVIPPIYENDDGACMMHMGVMRPIHENEAANKKAVAEMMIFLCEINEMKYGCNDDISV